MFGTGSAKDSGPSPPIKSSRFNIVNSYNGKNLDPLVFVLVLSNIGREHAMTIDGFKKYFTGLGVHEDARRSTQRL